VRIIEYAPDLDTILTGDQPLATIDLPYDQRQEAEVFLYGLDDLCPEAGGEVVGAAIHRTRHRLTQGGVDGVRSGSATHAT
jgi:hypothetical protein